MWHGVGMEISYGMLRLFIHSEFVNYSCAGASNQIGFQPYLDPSKVNPSRSNQIVGVQEAPKAEEKGRVLILRFGKVMVNAKSLRIRYQEQANLLR